MNFHYLARGIIFRDGKVLLAHMKGADNTFLPGGHIEPGEKAETALLREIEEELGQMAEIRRFIGAVECAYTDKGQENHEINLLFEIWVPGLEAGQVPASKESHLEFLWSEPSELDAHNLLPAPLIECMKAWGHGYKAYWGSSFS